MDKYILISSEGKTENEALYNFRSTLLSLFNNDYNVSLNRNRAVLTSNKKEGMPIETDFEIFACGSVVSIIAIFFSEAFFSLIPQQDRDKFSKGDMEFIVASDVFKTLIIPFVKPNLVAAENGFIASLLDKYDKHQINIDEIPIYIKCEKDYQFPMAVYDHMHKLDENIQKYLLSHGL